MRPLLLTLALASIFSCVRSSTAASENVTSGSSDDFVARIQSGEVLLLDVREPSELLELGTLEGYLNIPLDQLEGRLSELPTNRPILTA